MSESNEMPESKFAPTRTDGTHIGGSVKKLVDLMLEGRTLRAAALELGISQRVAERALRKPHVRAFARAQKLRVLEDLSMNVPNRLHELMLRDDNQNAAVRAATALYSLASDELAARQLIGTPRTAGLTIQIVTDTSKPPLTIDGEPAPPAIGPLPNVSAPALFRPAPRRAADE